MAIGARACLAFVLCRLGDARHGNSQPCEGLHGSQNVTCIWEEAVKACVADKCTDCGEHECQLCQQESVKVSHCCTANSHPDSEPPQMCKEAMLAEEIKACIGVQCAGCAGQECAACEHRPSVVSSCCDGDFHSALAPPQCRNTTSTSPCARLVGQEALTCAWAEDVRTCIEAGCSSCAGDCPNCRDDSFRISACCDQHFHPAAAPPICAQAILTEDVKRCVAARCADCDAQCQSCRSDLVHIAVCCKEHNHTGHPPPYCDEALSSIATPSGTVRPILP